MAWARFFCYPLTLNQRELTFVYPLRGGLASNFLMPPNSGASIQHGGEKRNFDSAAHLLRHDPWSNAPIICRCLPSVRTMITRRPRFPDTKKQARTSYEVRSLLLKTGVGTRLLRVIHLHRSRGGRDFPELRHRTQRGSFHIAGAATAGRQEDSDGAGGNGEEQTNHGGLGLTYLVFLESVF